MAVRAFGFIALLACVLAAASGAAPALAQEPARVEVAAAPRTVLFGDQLELRADVLFAPDAVDSDSVELEADFPPFDVAAVRRDTERGSELSRVRFVVALRCLSSDCLPPEGSDERSFQLPAVRVRLSDEGGERTLEAPAPRVAIETRLNPREARDEAGWSYDDRDLPAVSHPVSPGLASALLLVGAGGLVVLSGALAVYATTGRSPRAAVTARRGTPLERALALARRAAAREPEERRRALERLARELDRAGHTELAELSGTLAWARPEPAETAIGALLADVERARAQGVA